WNYRTAAKAVIALVETSSYRTVEALATAVARILVTDHQAPYARVRVHKPGALRVTDSVGVIIEAPPRTFPPAWRHDHRPWARCPAARSPSGRPPGSRRRPGRGRSAAGGARRGCAEREPCRDTRPDGAGAGRDAHPAGLRRDDVPQRRGIRAV